METENKLPDVPPTGCSKFMQDAESEKRGAQTARGKKLGHRFALGLFSLLFLISAVLTVGVLLPAARSYGNGADGRSDSFDTVSTALTPAAEIGSVRSAGVNGNYNEDHGIFLYKDEPVTLVLGQTREITLGDIYSWWAPQSCRVYVTSIDKNTGVNSFVTETPTPSIGATDIKPPVYWSPLFSSIKALSASGNHDIYQESGYLFTSDYVASLTVPFLSITATDAPLARNMITNNKVMYLWFIIEGTAYYPALFYTRIPIIFKTDSAPMVANNNMTVDAGNAADGKTTRIYLNGLDDFTASGGPNYKGLYDTWGQLASANRYNLGASDSNIPRRNIYIDSVAASGGADALATLTVGGNPGNADFCPLNIPGDTDYAEGSGKKGYYIELTPKAVTGSHKTVTLTVKIKQNPSGTLSVKEFEATVTVTVRPLPNYPPAAGGTGVTGANGAYEFSVTTRSVAAKTGYCDIALTAAAYDSTLPDMQDRYNLNFTEDARQADLSGNANQLYFQTAIDDVTADSAGAYTNYISVSFERRTAANMGVLRIMPVKRTPANTPVMIKVYINDSREGQGADTSGGTRAALTISITVPNSAPSAAANPITDITLAVGDNPGPTFRDIAVSNLAQDADIDDGLMFLSWDLGDSPYFEVVRYGTGGDTVRITAKKKTPAAVTLTLSVTDGVGYYDAEIQITVTNSTPIAAADTVLEFGGNQLDSWITYDVRGMFATDADSEDTLNVTAVTYHDYGSYAVSDGNFINIESVNPGTVGFRPLHSTPEGGISVTIRISDGAVSCDAVVTVIINNSLPVSKNNTVSLDMRVSESEATAEIPHSKIFNAALFAEDKDVTAALPAGGIASLYDGLYFYSYEISPARLSDKVSVAYLNENRDIQITADAVSTEQILITLKVIDKRSGGDGAYAVTGYVSIGEILPGLPVFAPGNQSGFTESNPLELIVSPSAGRNYPTSRTYDANEIAESSGGSADLEFEAEGGGFIDANHEEYLDVSFTNLGQLTISAKKSTRTLNPNTVTVTLGVRSKSDSAMRITVTIYVRVLNSYISAAAPQQLTYILVPNGRANVLAADLAVDADGDAISAVQTDYATTNNGGVYYQTDGIFSNYITMTRGTGGVVLFTLTGKASTSGGNKSFSVRIYISETGAISANELNMSGSVLEIQLEIYFYDGVLVNPPVGNQPDWPDGVDPDDDPETSKNGRFITVKAGTDGVIVLNNELSYTNGAYTKWFAQTREDDTGFMRLAGGDSPQYYLSGTAAQYISVSPAVRDLSAQFSFSGTGGQKNILFDTLTITGLSRTPYNDTLRWNTFTVYLTPYNENDQKAENRVYAVNIYFRVTNSELKAEDGTVNATYTIGQNNPIYADTPFFEVGIFNNEPGAVGQLGGAGRYITVADRDRLDVFLFSPVSDLTDAAISKYAAITFTDGGKFMRIVPKVKTNGYIEFTVQIKDTFTGCDASTVITVTVRLYITNSAPVIINANVNVSGGYGDTFEYGLSSLVKDIDAKKLTAPAYDDGYGDAVTWGAGDFDFTKNTLLQGYDKVTPVIPLLPLPPSLLRLQGYDIVTPVIIDASDAKVEFTYDEAKQKITLRIVAVFEKGTPIAGRNIEIRMRFADNSGGESAETVFKITIITGAPKAKNPMPAQYLSVSKEYETNNSYYVTGAEPGTLAAHETLFNRITVDVYDIAESTNGNALELEIFEILAPPVNGSPRTAYTGYVNAKIVYEEGGTGRARALEFETLRAADFGDGSFDIRIAVGNGDRVEYNDLPKSGYYTIVTVTVVMIPADAEANALDPIEMTAGGVRDVPLAAYDRVTSGTLYTSLNMGDEIRGEGTPNVEGVTGANTYLRAEFITDTDRTKSVLRLTALKKLPAGVTHITVKPRVSTSAQRAKKASNIAVAELEVTIKNSDLNGADSINTNPDQAVGVSFDAENNAFRLTVNSRAGNGEGYAVTEIPMYAFIKDADIGLNEESIAAAAEYYSLYDARTFDLIGDGNPLESADNEFGVTIAASGAMRGKALRVTGRYATGGEGKLAEFWAIDSRLDNMGNPMGDEPNSQRVKISIYITVKNNAPTVKSDLLSTVKIGGYKNDVTTIAARELADDLDISLAEFLGQKPHDALSFAHEGDEIYGKLIKSGRQPTLTEINAAEITADNGYIRLTDNGDSVEITVLKRPAAANERTFWIVLLVEDAYGAKSGNIVLRVDLQNSPITPNRENVTAENGAEKYSVLMETGFSAVINLSDIISDADYEDVLKYTFSLPLETGDERDDYKLVLSDDGKMLTITMKKLINDGYVINIGPFTVKDDGGAIGADTYFITLTLLNTAPALSDEYAKQVARYDETGDITGLHRAQAVLGNTVTLSVSDIAADVNRDELAFVPGSFTLVSGNGLIEDGAELQVAARPRAITLTSLGVSGTLEFTIQVADNQLNNGISLPVRVLVIFAAVASSDNIKANAVGAAIIGMNLTYARVFDVRAIFDNPFGILVTAVEYGIAGETRYAIDPLGRYVRGVSAGETFAYVTFDSAGETSRFRVGLNIRKKTGVELNGVSDRITVTQGDGHEYYINDLLRSPDDRLIGALESVKLIGIRVSDKNALSARIEYSENKFVIEPKVNIALEDNVKITVTVQSGEGADAEEFTFKYLASGFRDRTFFEKATANPVPFAVGGGTAAVVVLLAVLAVGALRRKATVRRELELLLLDEMQQEEEILKEEVNLFYAQQAALSEAQAAQAQLAAQQWQPEQLQEWQPEALPQWNPDALQEWQPESFALNPAFGKIEEEDGQ